MPALERAAGASLPVGGEHLVAAAVADRAELPVHPAVGVPDPKIAVDQPETLPETVHEPLVELLERRRLAPGSIQHHDDDGEGGEEVAEHECRVDREVAAGLGRGVEERRHDPVNSPEREGSGKEAGSSVARLLPPRPELEPRQDQDPAGHEPRRASRGDARVRQVAEAGGHQRAEPADQEGTLADPVVGAKSEAPGQYEEGGHEECRIEERAQDIPLGQKGPRDVKALRHAHQAPGQEQVVEEAHAMRGVDIGEDQKLERQREDGGEGQCRRHGLGRVSSGDSTRTCQIPCQGAGVAFPAVNGRRVFRSETACFVVKQGGAIRLKTVTRSATTGAVRSGGVRSYGWRGVLRSLPSLGASRP